MQPPKHLPWLLVLVHCLVISTVQAQPGPLDQARSLVASRTSFDQAKSLLEKVTIANPNSAEAHFLLGKVLYAFGDYEKASAEAEKAVSLDGSKSEYHWLLGNSLAARLDSAGLFKKLSLARQTKAEFEQAIAKDPKNLAARADLAVFFAEAPSIAGGGDDKAIEQIKQISAIDAVEGHYAMAEFYAEKKKLTEAEKESRAARDADPTRAKSYVRLAYIYLMEKKDSDALPLFKRALELDPDYLPGYLGVARGDLLSGQNLDEAERFFKKYLSRWPEDGDPSLANAHWRLGQVYEKQGKKDLAVSEWTEALKLNPSFTPARDSLKAAGR